MKKETVPMTKAVPALTARTHFGQLMQRARTGRARFLVSKKGEPQVVILGVEDYFRTVLGLKEPPVLKRIHEAARARGLDKLSMAEIDRIVRSVRRELARRTA
jgi:prevent-host-death family protein